MLGDIKAPYGAKRRHRQISLCSTLLCFTDIVGFFFSFVLFYKSEGLWQLGVEQVYRCHFSKRICSSHVSRSHSGNSCNISSVSLFLYL